MVNRSENSPRKVAFLDRDGVLNESLVIGGKPFAPRSLIDFKIYSYSASAVLKLKNSGFYVVVVTNQPDVGNGKTKKLVVENMNKLLSNVCAVDEIKVCFHAQNAGCDCRKPKVGMLRKATETFNCDLSNSFLVGDRNGDLEAARRFGCRPIFINRNYKELVVEKFEKSFNDLEEASNYIIGLYP